MFVKNFKIFHKSYRGSIGSIRVPADNVLLNSHPLMVQLTVHEEEDVSIAADFPPTLNYTTPEKWMIDQQKKKLTSYRKNLGVAIAANTAKKSVTVHENKDVSVATDLPPFLKYTTLGKWMLEQQKRNLLPERTWASQ